MTDDFTDLLGGPAPRRGGRPTNAERDKRLAEAMQSASRQAEIRRAGAGHTKIQAEELKDLPVSQNWLAEFFNMSPDTVKKRLAKCPVAGYVGSGRPVYIFQDTVSFLIKPKWDIATYLKTLNIGDMPLPISKVYWEAERTKNKTLLETGQAWPTSKVLETLGQVFMMIKDRIPLIREGMRDEGLTDPQSDVLEKLCDQFQRDLHEALVEMPSQQKTFSRQIELEGLEYGEVVDAE